VFSVKGDAMSENRVLSMFAKSGEWHRFSRRFHSLSREAQRIALSLIKNDMSPDKAIKTAKKAVNDVN
jgi:hypothetical protein